MKVPFREYSPITAAVAAALNTSKYLSPMTWLSRLRPELKPRSEITQAEIDDVEWAKRRARAVEWYVLGTVLVLIALVLLSSISTVRDSWFRYAIVVLALLKILEVVQVTVNAVVFDRFSGRPDDEVASTARMVVLAMVNFLELAVWFGLIYAMNLKSLRGAAKFGDAFYFSGITQVTIGYGDVHPVGILKAVAVLHGFIGVGFLVLVVARLVSALPPIHGRFD